MRHLRGTLYLLLRAVDGGQGTPLIFHQGEIKGVAVFESTEAAHLWSPSFGGDCIREIHSNEELADVLRDYTIAYGIAHAFINPEPNAGGATSIPVDDILLGNVGAIFRTDDD